MNNTSLETIRVAGMRVVAIGLAVMAVASAAGELIAGAGGLITLLLVLALPVYPILLALRGSADARARMIATMSFVAQPALLVFVFRGAAWQVDLHMAFFAALAITAVLCDWKALIAGAGVIAVHHLVLGMAVPDWVFLGGGGIGRVLLHAVILIAETVALVLLARQIAALLEALGLESAEREALAASTAAEREARARELEAAVTSISDGLQRIAEGDLTRRIGENFPAAYEVLRTNFNRTLGSLQELIGTVATSSSAIRTGSAQIADAADELSRRSASNAASLEETTAAMSVMDERLVGLAREAAHSVEDAGRALADVGNGREIAVDAVGAMERVSESAKGIDVVIEGLDKIAFQTRVLAMNAAVEAGRAGESGRGFAVVADLVSALAMRAEEEAKRAREQITVTQAEIGTAVSAVRKVDGALDGIARSVEAVHGRIGGMADENRAQSEAMSQIAAAIGQMDTATQQNVAMVEETTAAVQSLLGEVGALNEQTDCFRIEAAAPPRRAPEAVRAMFH